MFDVLDSGKNYTGDLITGTNGTMTNITNPFDCQELCLEYEDCHFFSYECNTKTCFLKVDQGTYIQTTDFISGPKSCNLTTSASP